MCNFSIEMRARLLIVVVCTRLRVAVRVPASIPSGRNCVSISIARYELSMTALQRVNLIVDGFFLCVLIQHNLPRPHLSRHSLDEYLSCHAQLFSSLILHTTKLQTAARIVVYSRRSAPMQLDYGRRIVSYFIDVMNDFADSAGL